MTIVYEVLGHWVQYGRPGGTPLDFDVARGTTSHGRFDTREKAEAEVLRLQNERRDEPRGARVDEVFDEYEIREVQAAESTE